MLLATSVMFVSVELDEVANSSGANDVVLFMVSRPFSVLYFLQGANPFLPLFPFLAHFSMQLLCYRSNCRHMGNEEHSAPVRYAYYAAFVVIARS